MKIDLKDLSPVKKSMSVEVDAAEVDREIEGVLRTYRTKARLPGFRPGKAPISLIRKRFAKEVEEDVRERIVSRCFAEAAREKGLRPLGDPALEDVSHASGQPLSFKTTFEVLPEIELKGYRDVEVRRPAVTVTDDEVDRTLEELRQARAQLVSEEGRTAVSGDVVITDVEGTPPEGEPFHRERMPVEVGSENNIPAFNEHLEGVQAGHEREFSVDYPEDYGARDLAGKRIRYRMKVHEVKRREVPDLDDEFAKDLGEFDDLGALRTKVRQDLEARKEHEAERAARQAVLDKVLLENPVVLPDVLVEREIRHRLEDMVRNMILQGMDPEKVEIDWADLRKRQEAPARKSVHAQLILDAVAAAEKIGVDDDAIDQRIREDAQRLGESPKKLRARLEKQRGTEALKVQMVREKSLDYLTSIANIQYLE